MDQAIMVILAIVLVILLANFLAALVSFVRRGFNENWLLVVVLAGTTGAAVVAILVMLQTLLGESLTAPSRLLDVAVILTGTAALTAAVRAAAGARTREDARAGHDTSGSQSPRTEPFDRDTAQAPGQGETP